MRSTVLAFLLLSARGGAAALAAWLVCRALRRAHAPSRLPVLAVAGRRAAVRAAVGHPAEAAPPGERPAGRCRRHRAGAGRAAAAAPLPPPQPQLRPCCFVRPADAVARAGGGLAGRCAGAGCARGSRLPEIKALCGAGLQNARRLLRRACVPTPFTHWALCARASTCRTVCKARRGRLCCCMSGPTSAAATRW